MIRLPRILVVDYSTTTYLFIAATLELAGYDVEVVLKGLDLICAQIAIA